MIQKPYLLTLFITIFSFLTSFAQPKQWNEINENEIIAKEKMARANTPSAYKLFQVDFSSLKNELLNAPIDETNETSNTFVNFPDANGTISSFEIYNSPMMEPELAAKAPEIHNFTGINKKDPTNIIKISITPAFGMHIMGYDGSGTTYYVDTYTEDFNSYIFYNRKDIQNSNSDFRCLVENNNTDVNNMTMSSDNQILSIDNKFRRYRFAMACTIEYTAFHVNAAPNTVPKNTVEQKKDIVLSAMNVTINRLNTIYERDLSIRLVLVANNRDIIYVTSDDFSNNNAGQLINQSQSTITLVIGTANFDIGHTVSTGGGGLASPAPCSSNRKASGITGSARPVGDPFDIDYVAHEVGHQFGANHSYNNSCDGNRNISTAVEPGSGSTIMAYAGICGPNVQNNSDAYFHQISIREITNFLQSNGNSCATLISTSNPPPVITATSGNKNIPHSTPFVLTTTATDTNNPNSLTYTWEQTNNQVSNQPPVANSTTGPNFRSFGPTSNPSRSFPSVETVLSGTTNSNGVVSSTWERLPSVARTMNFATTVRDNNAISGGQTKSSDLTITFANSGPFVITYPNNITNSASVAMALGTENTITWNVAGTTANGINVANVNILLSTNNGQTYSMLAPNVPNNGNFTVTIPANTTVSNQCRIKIEAVGNIFYTVSKAFSITTLAANDTFEFDNFNLYPNPTSDLVTISFASTTSENITMELFDIRGRSLKSYKIENSGLINTDINLSNYESGIYLIKIKDGANQTTKKVIKK